MNKDITLSLESLLLTTLNTYNSSGVNILFPFACEENKFLYLLFADGPIHHSMMRIVTCPEETIRQIVKQYGKFDGIYAEFSSPEEEP